MSQTAVQIPVRSIESAPTSDSAGVRALFDSILQWGILQPLIVRRIAGSARYEVVSGCKRFASAVSAGFSEVPCVVFEGSEAEASALAAASNVPGPLSTVSAIPQVSPPPLAPLAPLFEAVLSELQATRSSIADSLRLVQHAPGGLRPRMARERADIELQRAAWILDGLQLLNADEPGTRVPVGLGPLLRSVIDAFRPECRLSAIDVRLVVEPSDLAAICDEVGLRASLNCAIGALLAVMHHAPQAGGALSVLAKGMAGGVVISIAQDAVPFQELARLRSGTRRGEIPQGEGVLTSFGLEAAKRGIESQGGRLELRPDPPTAAGAVDLKLQPAAGGTVTSTGY